ncbi:MAG: hypothetical protein U1E33_03400 [Rhodospirillales bacterium]
MPAALGLASVPDVVFSDQLKAEVLGHRPEIAIGGEQRMAAGDAEGTDDQIDGLT